jgi:hypothetical protein
VLSRVSNGGSTSSNSVGTWQGDDFSAASSNNRCATIGFERCKSFACVATSSGLIGEARELLRERCLWRPKDCNEAVEPFNGVVDSVMGDAAEDVVRMLVVLWVLGLVSSDNGRTSLNSVSDDEDVGGREFAFCGTGPGGETCSTKEDSSLGAVAIGDCCAACSRCKLGRVYASMMCATQRQDTPARGFFIKGRLLT